MYSAKALEKICHREKPYVHAREGYEEGEPCNNVIDKKIFSYYKDVSQRYNISLSNLCNIKDYLNFLLNR